MSERHSEAQSYELREVSDRRRGFHDLVTPEPEDNGAPAMTQEAPNTASSAERLDEGPPLHSPDDPTPKKSWFSIKRRDEYGESSRLDNPLHHWRRNEVDAVARCVAAKYGLSRFEHLFLKAGRVLYDPDPNTWETSPAPANNDHRKWPIYIGPLTAEEKSSLDFESQGRFWDQPWPLQTTYLMLFMAAIVQGWSQTGTNGANLDWLQGLHPNVTTEQKDHFTGELSCRPVRQYTWEFAVINAAPYLAASVGSWISDPIINELLFGRRGAIFLSASLIFVCSIGSAFVSHPWQLLIWRIFLGVGMGCKAAVVPVFAAEIAPGHLRGSLVMNWQIFDSLGIFLGFCANLVASTASKSKWRWQLASSAIPAFALICGVAFICWDSPRFLMKHEEQYRQRYDNRQRRQGNIDSDSHAQNPAPTAPAGDPTVIRRVKDCLSPAFDYFRPSTVLPYRSEAYQTLVLLRGHPILAARELMYAHCQILVEMQSSESNANDDDDMNFSLNSRSGWSWFSRFKSLFAKDYVRREVYAALVVMISQQLCGINILIFYSSTIFCTSGSGTDSAQFRRPLELSMGLGLVNFFFGFPAYWLIESRGRRWLLLVTLPFLAITMAAAAGSSVDDDQGHKSAVAAFTYLFTMIYSLGLGPVPFTLSAEMFPLEERMVGMSLAVSANFCFAGFLALVVPLISQAKLLGIFAGLNVVAFGLVWIYVREVAGGPDAVAATRPTSVSLEVLFYIFKLHTVTHIDYQWKVVLPYLWDWTCKLLTCRELPAKPKGFYDWGRRREEEKAHKYR